MSFIDKYYVIFNNSVGQHSITISRAEFANLLGVFSKQEQQLDQLKAENEELKKQHQADKGLITSTGKMNYHLLQEYDKLKAEFEQFKKAEEYDSRYNDLQAEIDCGERMIEKLKQTLTEIKEIVEIENNDIKVLYNRRTYQRMKQILQKISEVTNEN